MFYKIIGDTSLGINVSLYIQDHKTYSIFFSYVLNVFSECELIVNVDTQILETISLGNFELNISISFFPTAKFLLSHFVVFKVSLFWQNQCLTLSCSLFISVASRFPILMRLVSSANSAISASFPHISGRSLIYRRNKKRSKYWALRNTCFSFLKFRISSIIVDVLASTS